MRKFKLDRDLSKKIASLVMAGMLSVTCMSLTGCKKKDETQTSSTTQIVDVVDSNNNKIYDYEFLKSNYEEENVDSSINWDLLDDILAAKSEYFAYMFIPTKHELNHNYELAVYQDEEKYDGAYLQIINKDGLYKNGVKYHMIQAVNDYISILSLDENLSNEQKCHYVIFNHNTGSTTEITTNGLFAANGYIVKRDLIDDSNKKCQLLYPNGELASKEDYDEIVIDYYTNNVFLVKDNQTIILNTETGKAKKIDGIVKEARGNYTVISNSYNLKGLYLLKDFELIQKIENKFNDISMVTFDINNPVFSCRSMTLDSPYESKEFLYSSEGERLSNAYEFLVVDYQTGYIESIVSYGEKQDTLSLIDYSGVEVLSNFKAGDLNPIPNTDLIAFTTDKSEDAKLGIMDFDKNVLKKAIFDHISVHNIYTKDDQILTNCIIARIENQNKTIVYDENLNELLSGDFGYYQAIRKIDELNVLEDLVNKKTLVLK